MWQFLVIALVILLVMLLIAFLTDHIVFAILLPLLAGLIYYTARWAKRRCDRAKYERIEKQLDDYLSRMEGVKRHAEKLIEDGTSEGNVRIYAKIEVKLDGPRDLLTKYRSIEDESHRCKQLIPKLEEIIAVGESVLELCNGKLRRKLTKTDESARSFSNSLFV